MSLQGPKTKAIFQRASKVLPYGVNSNFRYWGEDDTLIITRGQDAYIWDADGKKYIDYRLAFGPIILGHAHPAVSAAVAEAIQQGILFAWTTPLEIEVAEHICRLTGVDKVRLTNTGTEATMHALRVARAYTGRENFIKFEGMYHGMHDYVLFDTASTPLGALGSRRSPVSVPVSSGIPRGIAQYVTNLPFNDFDLVEAAVKANWGNTAAILVEPVMGNSAGIMPVPGFLAHLRELCDAYGIVLIFDEVKTGFRIATGGAQQLFGVRADLVTYAKALGNGFPIAALAGKEEVMMTINPGEVVEGGTFTGNVVGTAAARATLELLENEPVMASIQENGRTLMNGIDEILTRRGIPHAMSGLPSMFSYSLGIETAPRDYRDYCQSDLHLYEELAMELARRGVCPDVDGREPWFLCYSHTAAVVEETLSAFEGAVETLSRPL